MMNTPFQRFALSFLFLTLFSGCFWVENSNFESAVWADDGSAVAYVGHSYMAKNAFTYTKKKEFHTRLYVSEELQSQDHVGEQVGSVMPGQTVSLYYMKREGYLLVGRWSEIIEDSATSTLKEFRTFTYDKVTLDGTKTQVARETGPIMLSCNNDDTAWSGLVPLEVIPSPDGKRLAVIKGVNTCEGPSQTVTFLDATTLQPQGESIEVDLIALVPESAGDPQYTLSFLPKAWLDNDNFMIGFGAFQNDGTQGWVYSPNTEPQWHEGVAFDCLYPSTTSSYVDASGRVVYVTDWGTFHHGPEDDDFEETSYGCSE